MSLADYTGQIDWAGFYDDAMTEKFRLFHAENAHIEKELASRAMELQARGHQRCGMGMLFEVMRWSHMLKTNTDEPFKLNNNYRAYYARVIEADYPSLKGFFTKRGSKADDIQEPEQ